MIKKYKVECQDKYCIETDRIFDHRINAEKYAEKHMMKTGHVCEIITLPQIKEESD